MEKQRKFRIETNAVDENSSAVSFFVKKRVHGDLPLAFTITKIEFLQSLSHFNSF